MLQKLTIIITLLSISLSASAVSDQSSATIDHFVLSPTPHIVLMTIPGFKASTISDVYDVGKYAFADDIYGQYAYFDGESWSPIQTDSNDKCLLSPDYPTTGKNGGAWFWCDDGIKHFDPSTKTFSTSVDVSKRLGIDPSTRTHTQVYIASSGGFLFLIGQNQATNTINFAIYNQNKNQWSPHVTVSSPYSNFSIDDVSANDDANPRVLVNMSEDMTSNPLTQVLQINQDGSYYLVPQLEYNNTYQLHPHAPLIISGLTSYGIFQNLYDKSYSLIYNNALTSNTWKVMQLPGVENYPDFSFNRKDLFNSNLCKLLTDENYLFEISCINIHAEQPTWSQLIKIANIPLNNTIPYLETRTDGAWLGYHLDGDQAPVILDYDAKNKTVTNTQLAKYVPILTKVIPRGIGPHNLLACLQSIDNSKPIQIYVYNNSSDKKTWSKINAGTSELTSCDMSQLGYDSYHDFWIF